MFQDEVKMSHWELFLISPAKRFFSQPQIRKLNVPLDRKIFTSVERLKKAGKAHKGHFWRQIEIFVNEQQKENCY